jgi:hypothetical protein
MVCICAVLMSVDWIKIKIGVTPSKYRDEKFEKADLQEEKSINDDNIDKKKAENLESSILYFIFAPKK